MLSAKFKGHSPNTSQVSPLHVGVDVDLHNAVLQKVSAPCCQGRMNDLR